MDILREKIARAIWEECDVEMVSADAAANAILAIPELKEALRALESREEDYWDAYSAGYESASD